MESGSNCKKVKEGIDFPNISAIIRVFVTVQQVCAFTALTVRKLGLEGKNPIGIADLEWIFARNREDTEQLHYKSVKIFFSNSISPSFFILESSADRALLSTAR